MRVGGGHAKGSAFEREIAKKIVKAFSIFGIVQRDCWRSVLSGGHPMSAGDLVMSQKLLKLFPYAVECKFRKKIRWDNFLLGNEKSEEMRWIEQAKEGASKNDGIDPLLVMKGNFGKIMVMFPAELDWGRKKPAVRLHGAEWRVLLWTTFLKDEVRRARGRNSYKTE